AEPLGRMFAEGGEHVEPVGGLGERGDARDMHRRLRRLQVEKRRIERGNAVHAVFPMSVSRRFAPVSAAAQWSPIFCASAGVSASGRSWPSRGSTPAARRE